LMSTASSFANEPNELCVASAILRPMQRGTFSIVARCKKSGDFGVASATAAPCVGALLPFAQEGVGAIATQAWVNVNLGYVGLELMRSGLSAKNAIEALLVEDLGRQKRQVIAIDSESVFGYTGKECTEAKGHILGDDYAVAGNILADKRVLESMVETFLKSKGELSSRLLKVIEAGQAAGGDHRGKMSSALLVASCRPRIYHDVRVDFNDDPVSELRRIYDECVRLQEEYGDDDGGEELRIRVSRVQR
jgi:uncharacterized Ntn-hydrolase superfamily protein